MSEGAVGRTSLHPDEALALVEDWNEAPEVERVPLDRALGRALAEDLPALVDQPPFDKSAMDGFAYGEAAPSGSPESETSWRIAGLVAAGHGRPARALAPGECARIMTGAPLPPGAKGVQRVEWTVEDTASGSVRFTRPESISNIIPRGENQRAGDILMPRRVLSAQDIGAIASSGYAEIAVARKPVVCVLSTGDELAAPGETLRDGAIYDTNGVQLAAQAVQAGCDARFLGIVRDEAETIDRAVAEALDSCDILVVSGGVSMGDFDYVPRALAAAGTRQVYHGLAMKPGKPSYFGLRGGKAAFGLPGNPVSTFVGFELFVKAHAYRRLGLRYVPRHVAARLAEPISRRETERLEFLPARLESQRRDEEPLVRPIRYHGSSMLSALAEADCLIRMEIGESRLEEGRIILARLVRP
jgi:molybdopterin molybdotransferase